MCPHRGMDTSMPNDKTLNRRRGRKPRDKVYSVTDPVVPIGQEGTGEHVILYLPVSSKDVTLDDQFEDIPFMQYDPDYREPTPFVPDLNAASVTDKINNQAGGRTVTEYRDDKSNVTVNNILYATDDELNSFASTTKVWCWWCCHPFDGPPISIPLHDKHYGVFCSHNCAAAYLFNDAELQDRRWDAYNKLNVEFNRGRSGAREKVKMAPPKISLKCFGGYMSIEEFRRHNQKNDTTFKLMLPPLTMLIPQVEHKRQPGENERSPAIPVDKEKLKMANDNLALKRSKPILNDRHTLSSYMSIKKVHRQSGATR